MSCVGEHQNGTSDHLELEMQEVVSLLACMGAGNGTQFSWKSSECFEMWSHLYIVLLNF